MKMKASVVILLMLIALVAGCSSSSSSDPAPAATTQTITLGASGTYSYNSSTKVLTVNITSSDFTEFGPPVGTMKLTILSLTSSTMQWRNEEGEIQNWTKVSSKAADDLIGTWQYIDEDGDTWEVTFNSDGTVSVYGYIQEEIVDVEIDTNVDTCQEALDQVNSLACSNEAAANVDAFKTCLINCGGSDSCEGNCGESFLASIPSCLPGLLLLIDDGNDIAICGSCYTSCGDYMEQCLVTSSGQQCMNDMLSCINSCSVSSPVTTGCNEWDLNGGWSSSGTCGGPSTEYIGQYGCDIYMTATSTSACSGTITGNNINFYCYDEADSSQFNCNLTINNSSSISGSCTVGGGCSITLTR